MSGDHGGSCWWCCMRALEKCLPRNDIVRELAPYLQHVHSDEAVEEDGRPAASAPSTVSMARIQSPRQGPDCAFVAYEERGSVTTRESVHQPPMLYTSGSTDHPDDVDEIVEIANAAEAKTRAREGNNSLLPIRVLPPMSTTSSKAGGAADGAMSSANSDSGHGSAVVETAGGSSSGGEDEPIAPCPHTQPPPPPQRGQPSSPVDSSTTSASGDLHPAQQPPLHAYYSQMVLPLHHSEPGDRNAATRSAPALVEPAGARDSLSAPSLKKKTSLPKIKSELGDLVAIQWEKAVIVQVSVQGFREMMVTSKDLMEEAKLLYEHTVLSRLSTEYGGQELLSHPRSGLFVIAFASEFHAAKWCLSLQLSLVYAAWNEKLLKKFADMKEVYTRQSGRARKNILLYRGFRVRMVIHTADPDLAPEISLADAVKWTNTVTEFAHGGQIILSSSVWDRLKEQLVQLGNPVVEDLGVHGVLEEEVMLMLLLPRDLECRRFPNLKSPHQLSLGMRDAPAAQKQLTMVFTFIEGARPLVRTHAEELAERIKTLCTVARQLLRKHNGYECQELQGDFMLAFFSPVCAVLWCGEFQLRIREKFHEWNRDSQNKELMFSMSMGIEVGVPASVSPHKTSGRADYFGNIVNQTARIAKAAHGGQILMGGAAWNAFSLQPQRFTPHEDRNEIAPVSKTTIFMFKSHGYYSFKGISRPIALVEAFPIKSPKTHIEQISFGVLPETRDPKATLATEEQINAKSKVVLASIPTCMLRLSHATKIEHQSIRETELGDGVSWDEEVTIVDDDQDSADEDSELSSAIDTERRSHHSYMLQAMRAEL